MKKTNLINSEISYLISKLGHGDSIVIEFTSYANIILKFGVVF